MTQTIEQPQTSELCYLDASKVQSPAGALSELDVLTADGDAFGSIEGVVIDAANRRVRYLDVQASGWFKRRRYLLEADQLGHLEPERHALRLRADTELAPVSGVDASALRRFSDDDLAAAMFPKRAA